MKNLLLISIFILILSSCSKTESSDLTTLTITAGLEYGVSNTPYPISGKFTLYLYEDVSIHDGYVYVGNGTIKQTSTGKVVQYTQKITTEVFYIFKDLQRKTYTVFIDGTNLFNDNVKLKTNGVTVNLNNDLSKDGGEEKFTFNIWPYNPWDIYK